MKNHLIMPLLLLSYLFILVAPITAQESALYELPGENIPVYTSGSMQLANNGQLLLTANMFVDTVSIIELSRRTIIAEIPVGDDPRTIAVTPDNSHALVVNRGDGTVSVIDIGSRTVIATYPVGVLPYAVVINNNQTAFISLQGTDELIELEIWTGHIAGRVSVPDAPAGLAAWGDFVYATHLWSGDISLIYSPQMRLVQTASMGIDAALSQSLTINPFNGRAYLPQTRNNPQNSHQTFDTWVFPVINAVDLGTLTTHRLSRINIDQISRPVNIPFAADLDPYRNWLYVVNAGSDDLSIIDLNTNTAVAHFAVGANPRDIRLTGDNATVYVHNALENTVTVIETYRLDDAEAFFVSNGSIPVEQLTGLMLFHSATDRRISRGSRVSCANCHFDGVSDGRVWLLDGEQRNTPLLIGLLDTAPDDWPALEWLNVHLRDIQAGAGFNNNNDEFDLNLLMMTLWGWEMPPAPAQDPVLVEQGAVLYAALECESCHAGTMGIHDVGTGGEFDTPALSGLWLSAPYFHDGQAATLPDVFLLPGTHQIITQVSLDELAALVAFLKAQ